MPAIRKPTEVLELNGSYKHDPQRRRPPSAKSTKPLGYAPKHLSDAERDTWIEIVGNAPANVLTSADRLIVEMVARLVTKFRADWLTGPEFSQLSTNLARLGWSPADRSRITATPVEPVNEFAEFTH